MKLKETTIKKHLVYKGKILDLYCDDVNSYKKEKCTREYTTHPFAVASIVKYKNKYILEKQFRYPVNRVTLEIPAGKSNKGESPIKAVKREIKEETGLTINKIKSLGYFYPAMAYSNEKLYLYYVEANNQKEKQHLDKDEAINLVYLTKEEIIKLIKENKIDDAKTLIAFFKYFNL